MTSLRYQWFAFRSARHSVRYGHGTAQEAAEYLTYLNAVYGAAVYDCTPIPHGDAIEAHLETGCVLRCCDLGDTLTEIRNRSGACILPPART